MSAMTDDEPKQSDVLSAAFGKRMIRVGMSGTEAKRGTHQTKRAEDEGEPQNRAPKKAAGRNVPDPDKQAESPAGGIRLS